VEEHFNSEGSVKISEIKLMNGFGFIEYADALDARDIVPGTVSLLLGSSLSIPLVLIIGLNSIPYGLVH
jgi:hypothetical protein